MTATVRYRPEIDGLRAIAVTAVILNHFDRFLVPGGYLGVDIFFVISGYVITASLCAREIGGLGSFLLGFYARRFKRLMPALILCAIVTSIAISLFDADPGQSLRTALFALFGLSNLYLLRIANDYFGGLSQLNSFTHSWSLGVEEQFYLAFPLILWACLARRGRGGMMALRAVIIGLAALSLVLFAAIGADRPMAAFYLMPLRFWELAAGCLVAIGHACRPHPPATGTGRNWGASPILVLLVAALFVPPGLALFGNIAVVALTGAALAVLAPGSAAYRLLTSRPAGTVGMASYSLYLWHWPVLVIARYTIGTRGWALPILAALIAGLAQASFRYVEHPLRRQRWAANDGRTVLVGIATAAAAAGFVAMLAGPWLGRLYAGRPAALAARNVESLADGYRMAGTSYSWAGLRCILAADADAGKTIPLDACTLGRFAAAPRRVMVFGNSFAAAFVQGFGALVRDDHYAVTITSAWGSSPIREVANTRPWARSNAWYWHGVVPKLVARLRPGDWVLLISDLAELAPLSPDPRETQDLADYRQGLRRFSGELARSGIRLAVLDGQPFIRDANCRPENALPQWFAPGGGPCRFLTKAATLARRRPVDAMLQQLAQEHRIAVIDTMAVFCPGPTCTFQGSDGRVLYRDEFSHPSVEAAQAAAPLFRRVLTAPPALTAAVHPPVPDRLAERFRPRLPLRPRSMSRRHTALLPGNRPRSAL